MLVSFRCHLLCFVGQGIGTMRIARIMPGISTADRRRRPVGCFGIMDISLNLGEWNATFAVPSAVVDKHIKAADGLAVKVLLVILRNAGAKLSVEQIAGMLEASAEDVTAAVSYWDMAGIFSFGNGEGIRATNVTRVSSKPRHLTSVEVSRLLETSPDIRFMFDKLELLYGRTISAAERDGYVYLHESVGLPADVLVMIAEYCLSVGKASIHYVSKMALEWADSGIVTHEKAVERIMRLTASHQVENQVKKCFGIQDRALSKKERDYIRTWSEEYGFGIDLIGLAYERTIDNIGRRSFSYVDSILRSWHENRITTVAEAEEKDSPKKQAKKKEKSTVSYDLERFDQLGYDIPEIELEEKD